MCTWEDIDIRYSLKCIINKDLKCKTYALISSKTHIYVLYETVFLHALNIAGLILEMFSLEKTQCSLI